MRQIGVSLDDELLSRLDAWALGAGLSRSSAVRSLLRVQLVGEEYSAVPFSERVFAQPAVAVWRRQVARSWQGAEGA